MSKFTETADRMKRMTKAHDDRLDALNLRMDKHESESDAVYRSYEGLIEERELGMKEMEEGIKEMRNSMSEEEAADKVTKFPVDQSKALGTG